MASEPTQGSATRTDFFISYTSTDRAWAEWIAWQLEEAGYTTILQAWDFQAGNNFVQEMDQATRLAERTIAVLSPEYFQSPYTPSEWQAAFRRDPTSERSLLLPVRVRACDVEGLLGAIVHIDLVDLDADAAREYLLASVSRTRAKPTSAPAFPVSRSISSLASTPAPAFPGLAPATLWNVPFARNPFFTGREDELAWLREQLRQGNRAAIGQAQAISGLGGIGKTHLAVEYAFRFRQEYQAILWASADSLESLNASFSELARLLDLPKQEAREQEIVVQAVRTWLQTHDQWLLIMDNLDEPEVLFPLDERGQPCRSSPFLPPVPGGHLLITSRASDLTTLSLGMAHALKMETLSSEQSASLLLHRANLLAPGAVLASAEPHARELANQINQELDGLPLALDQAGAYLAATGESLEGYLRLFQQSRARLLQQHRGRDYPASVAATWTLSFQRVEERNPAAAELLHFLAFLAPDAIPEEILTEGADQLGPILTPVASDPFLLNNAIEVLRSYSLLIRDSRERTLAVHRLVQVVVRDSLPTEIRNQWMQRAILALAAACPEPDFANWLAIERLLPHALLCAAWIEHEQITTREAASLLSQAGCYLDSRARYAEAEPLLQRALVIREQMLGPEHPYIATSLSNLAALYQDQGKYEQAEPLFQRALMISKQVLEANHPDTAIVLNNLGLLYKDQRKYIQAVPLLQHALERCT